MLPLKRSRGMSHERRRALSPHLHGRVCVASFTLALSATSFAAPHSAALTVCLSSTAFSDEPLSKTNLWWYLRHTAATVSLKFFYQYLSDSWKASGSKKRSRRVPQTRLVEHSYRSAGGSNSGREAVLAESPRHRWAACRNRSGGKALLPPQPWP